MAGPKKNRGGKNKKTNKKKTTTKKTTAATTGTIVGTVGGGSMASVQGAQAVTMQMQTQPPQIQPTPQQAAAANNSAFPATDNAPYHDLYAGGQYYNKQNVTVSQLMAAMDYIDPKQVKGSLYGAGQNLNTAMLTGQKLTAQQTYMKNMLLDGMHNAGYNINLYRYDHSGSLNALLKPAGLDMNTASVANMKKALLGKTFQENRFLSTSYNDFKNAQSGNPFTDRQVRIIYKTAANTQVFMPGNTRNSQGQLLSWGEMVVAPNMKQKIVGVRELSKNGARPKGTPNGTKGARQIELVIELSL